MIMIGANLLYNISRSYCFAATQIQKRV